MSWIALIRAALEGLAALPKLVEWTQSQIQLYRMQQKMDELYNAMNALSKAETKEDRLNAIKLIARSTND